MPFNPANYQPLNIFFDFEIGGTPLTRIYIDPDIPIEFTATLTKGQSHFSCSFFDDTGYDVEPYLNLSQGGGGAIKGVIQWGYSRKGGNTGVGASVERVSQKIPFTMSRYSVAVGVNSFVLNVDGVFETTRAAYNSTPMSGTLNQIITIFADRYSMVLEFDDDLVIQGSNSALKGLAQDHTTELVEEEFHKDADEADFAFIKRILGKFVVDKQGKVGHPVYVTYNPETKQRILKISNKEKASKTVKISETEVEELVFEVQSPDSSVIEWAPELNFDNVVAMGGSDLIGLATGAISGQDTASSANNIVSENREHKIQPGGKYRPNHVPNADRNAQFPTEEIQTGENMDNRASRFVALPSRSPGASLIDVLNKHISQKKHIIATLTVMGDPVLQPDKRCTVIYNYPSSISRVVNTQRIAHYSSGTYYIKEVVHTVSAGQYITTLTLERDKVYINPGDRLIRSERLEN